MKTIKLPPRPVDSKVDDKWKVHPVLSNISKATAQRKFNRYLKTVTPSNPALPENIPPAVSPSSGSQTLEAAATPPISKSALQHISISNDAKVYPLPSASADGAPKPLIKFKTALHRLSQLFQNPPSH